ncbi:hypothetical protein RN001_000490 [Aquatica leii]|uniref:CHK kinase-like domain-containing protein n=1 Tax=Aquatica leii TaxID=1421715 RepID=A0AAN7SKL2_9COLE|nr:hypothetical protein RN001_000490 [Aquatica leii]
MTSVKKIIFNSEITKLLQNLLEEDNVHDYSIKTSAGTDKGHNVITLITQVDVNGYDDKGKQVYKHFIIKSSHFDKEVDYIFNTRDCFIREIYIYSKLFREFDLMQKENFVLKPFKSYPAYFASSLKLSEEFIILENIKTYGYKHWNREVPTDLNHARLMMKEYGRFHGLSFAIRCQKPELFEDIATNTDASWFEKWSTAGSANFNINLATYALKSLDPIDDKLIYNKFKEFLDSMYVILAKCIYSGSDNQYSTIIHLDCSLSNIMFKYEELKDLNKPTDICMLDWQVSCLGSPAIDIATLIFSSTDKKLRDAHYNELIEIYYNSFSLMLEQLRIDANQVLPFTILQQQLKKYSIFGLFMTLLMVFMQSIKKEDISESMQNSEQLGLKIKDVNAYNTRMRDILLDFNRYGYNFNFD